IACVGFFVSGGVFLSQLLESFEFCISESIQIYIALTVNVRVVGLPHYRPPLFRRVFSSVEQADTEVNPRPPLLHHSRSDDGFSREVIRHIEAAQDRKSTRLNSSHVA